MTNFYSKACRLSGTCQLPTSKSQSIRAIFFATMAAGRSIIKTPLNSPDITAMIQACIQLGATIEQQPNQLLIDGINAKPNTPDNIIDAGNSGQVLRFIACFAGLQSGRIVITGDHSIRNNRPVAPLIEALPQLGMHCETLRGDHHAPLILKGPFEQRSTSLCGKDSQPVSGLLMTAPFSPLGMDIQVRHPGEIPWINLTLSWLDRFNINYKNNNHQYFSIDGGHQISGFNYQVPGDLSTLSFPLAAALITQSSLTINHVDMSEPQGDKAIVKIFQQMGADIRINNQTQSLVINGNQTLKGISININHCIDCIAILAVVACFANSPTQITGAAIARQKESNRIEVIAHALNAMGGKVNPTADGLIIEPATLHGTKHHAHHDHRIAMSLAIAGFGASGVNIIEDVDCVRKSYPGFAQAMSDLGGSIRTCKENE